MSQTRLNFRTITLPGTFRFVYKLKWQHAFFMTMNKKNIARTEKLATWHTIIYSKQIGITSSTHINPKRQKLTRRET